MELTKFGHKVETVLYDSNCSPDNKAGLFCNSTSVWAKLDNGEWFRCDFKSQLKAIAFIDMAKNENDLLELIEEIKYKYE